MKKNLKELYEAVPDKEVFTVGMLTDQVAKNLGMSQEDIDPHRAKMKGWIKVMFL